MTGLKRINSSLHTSRNIYAKWYGFNRKDMYAVLNECSVAYLKTTEFTLQFHFNALSISSSGKKKKNHKRKGLGHKNENTPLTGERNCRCLD